MTVLQVLIDDREGQ